jgi:DNA repair exonuclease SbcCD nuclease subunit
MRLLVFSDLHLDAPFTWSGRDLGRLRRQALRDTLSRIIELALTEQVDAVLCGGDLYEHDRFTPDTRAFLREAFRTLEPIPVYLAPGNHDWYGDQSIYRQVNWSPNVHVFTEAHLRPVEVADGMTLWGAAHRAPANTDGFFDAGFRVDREGVNVALFHGSERSEFRWQEHGKAPHAPFYARQVAESGLDHAFCGHFHTPKDAEWHTYPGNPDPLTFGEIGERGAVIAEIGGDGTTMRTRHRVAVSEVHDCTVDLTGVTHSGEVRERVAAEVKGLAGVVRVTLVGEVEPEVDVRLRDVDSGWDHLEALVARRGLITVAYDLDELRSEKSVRGQFIRLVDGDEALDDLTRGKVLTTGLRALAGRFDDLEVV